MTAKKPLLCKMMTAALYSPFRISIITLWLVRLIVSIRATLRRFWNHQDEIDYLLKVSNAHFKQQLSQADIISTFSGVRPLCDDESDNPSAVTRDYTLALSQQDDQAPLLSVFGGKLTTYRKLAESAMQQLKAFSPEMSGSWTATEETAWWRKYGVCWTVDAKKSVHKSLMHQKI